MSEPEVVKEPCGMTIPVPATLTPAGFQYKVQTKLLHDAIKTLTRLNRPLVFELFCEPEKGVAGWRA